MRAATNCINFDETKRLLCSTLVQRSHIIINILYGSEQSIENHIKKLKGVVVGVVSSTLLFTWVLIVARLSKTAVVRRVAQISSVHFAGPPTCYSSTIQKRCPDIAL